MNRSIASARDAILDALPQETSLFGSAPEPRFTHVPASHAKALHPDVQVVVGMRGSGKSFWWAALQEEALRRLVAARARGLELFRNTIVLAGYGEKPRPNEYPGRDTLEQLLESYEPRAIWRAVLLHALRGLDRTRLNQTPGPDPGDWKRRVIQTQDHPEVVERFLAALDDQLDKESRHAIVVFDALDRSASSWEAVYRLVRGLLQVALDLRPYRRLRVKCFLRTDQFDEARLGDFPDASKVLSARVDLFWPAHELYAMFFQYLGNADREDFRREIEKQFRLTWREEDGVFIPPNELLRDTSLQRDFFHAITGPWMGRDRRRGFPYTWVVGHLADAHGQTSPRSFLAALRAAAEDSKERHPQHDWPLHYESIKRGVQRASGIRRQELQEDYPWVDALMKPLEGQVVPCPFETIAAVWRETRASEKLKAGGRLPPASLAQGPEGLRRDLEELGIFQRMRDGRVNIPDVYRVAYGVGRRGGVKPIKHTME